MLVVSAEHAGATQANVSRIVFSAFFCVFVLERVTCQRPHKGRCREGCDKVCEQQGPVCMCVCAHVS